MNDEIVVSICCITYNHGKFINQALDSFLMQKTNFKYEVIIYDDASTDNTAEIIRQYEEKYPEIIKPIYAKENQYSKGKQTFEFTFEKAKGKYIALCEGDDYWTDENKLQIQVDYMEKNEKCTFCFHDAMVLNMKNNEKENWPFYNKKHYKQDGNYNAGELDILGAIPTASYMFRAEHVEKIPEWFGKCIVGDRPIQLIMTSFGYAHYIDKTMSIYRVGIGSSAMDEINKQNEEIETAVKYWQKIEWMIDEFNCFSEYKYEKELNLSKNEIQLNILIVKKEYKKIIKEKKYRKLLGKMQTIKFLLKAYFPTVYQKMKKRLKKKI